MLGFIFIINVIASCVSLYAQDGFIIVSVADLVAQPFMYTSTKQIKEAYESLTLSPEQGKGSCLRVHQALFNEAVTIVDYQDDQVQVVVKNCFAKPMPGMYVEPLTVWMLRESILTEEECNELDDTNLFPLPYNEESRCDETTLTLLVPWYDEVTNTTYSAGTRFCRDKTKSTSETHAIKLYDAANKKSVSSHVPQSYALVSGNYTFLERRSMFVNLLYQWCTCGNSIPFVWGGTSFINYAHHKPVLKKWFAYGEQVSAWNYSSNGKSPLSGFDSSGLILRAAQICGFPYYCCNSSAVAHTLMNVPFSDIQEGDIVWAPGYLGVVASLDRNEIIEAQGYARGYGIVQCIDLKQRFSNAPTWHDFIQCCEKRIPLQSLDSQGRCVAHVPLLRLYRLPH